MAKYFLRSKHISRAKGARVTRAAAYRAGERIRDERTSEVDDHSDRLDVVYKEIAVPTAFEGREDMSWTQDRSTLWNAAEHAGRRRNSRLAREWLVLLPPELTSRQRIQLVRTFAKELADRYRCAVDVCVHAPRAGADRRNHHAHLLMTTREVTPDGLGRRTSLELGGRERHLLGIEGSSRDEYISIRERWAQIINEGLQHAGLSARVDHRSFKRQGIDREPTLTIPEKVFYAELRSGRPSAAGDEIRARHRERVEARLKGGDELARVLKRQKAAFKERAIEDSKRRESRPKEIRWGALTREQRNEKRRERYQARRAVEKLDSVGEEKRREASRLNARARMQRNPEAVREAVRRWRKANAEKVNSNQREYRKAHAQELAQKRREYRRAQAEEANRKRRDHGEQGAERSLSKSVSPSAEESAQRWKAYRDTHGPGPTAEESARNWLDFRERQKQSGPSQSAELRTRGRERQGTSAEDDDADRKPRRRQDHDHEL
jgi:MobA/MobL family